MLGQRRCLGRHVSFKICPSVSTSIGFTSPHPQSNSAKQPIYFHAEASRARSTDKRSVAFSPPSNELQGTLRVNAWEFLATYSQRKRGEVNKITWCCLFKLRHFLFFVLAIAAYYCPWHTCSEQWETSVRAGIFLKRTLRHRHLPPAQARANLDTSHWHPKAHSAVSRKVSTPLPSYRSCHLTC